jgi:Flp pilus assembly protein TadG
MPRFRIRGDVKRPRGQSIAEFAIILPVLLLLAAAAIDLGRLFYSYLAVENAAKEGALFGARKPLCDDELACPGPGQSVAWAVENEAKTLLKQGANSLLATQVTCLDTAGSQVPNLQDCQDGYKYIVTVSYQFPLITPIISSIVGNSLTLSSTSTATVIVGAINPAGIEALVWVEATSSAENEADIIAACVPADAATAPGFYYAPCQNTLNVDQYFLFREGQTVSYRFQVRNSGNLDLTGLTYTFQQNGSTFTKPASCNTLPTSRTAGSAAASCTFTRSAAVPAGSVGTSNHVVSVLVQGLAAGLATGVATGNAVVDVEARPRFVVNVRAAPYRLGGSGDGLLGAPQYGNGNLILRNSTDPLVDQNLRTPTGWLYLTVANQGGPAANLALTLTENGSPIAIPCTIPSALDAAGGPNAAFGCLMPAAALTTGAHAFSFAATADNSITVGGQQAVQISVAACGGSPNNRPVPNLVDVLSPTPDGTRNTVAQAQALWGPVVSGFTGALSTNPPAAPGTNGVISQSVTAFSCQNSTSGITVTAP